MPGSGRRFDADAILTAIRSTTRVSREPQEQSSATTSEKKAVGEKYTLINRVRIKDSDWKTLKRIAAHLTENNQYTTREELIRLAINGIVKYFEEKLKL